MKFTIKGGAHIVLQLLDEKNLQGTIRYKGTAQRLADLPLRLKKAE